MSTLTWQQIGRHRLTQHHLRQRLPRQQMLTAVSHILGLQAQVSSSAELALWARVEGLAADDVSNALWQDRTLVKMWAMRGTLHLLPTADFPLYVAALCTRKPHRLPSWQKYFGLTLPEMEATLEGIGRTLTDQGMTRQEIAAATAERMNAPHLKDLIASSWGSILKPASYAGDLCFGPSRGQNVTFVRPEKWLGPWQPLDSDEAKVELARRYLAAYGPATLDDFSRWFGSSSAESKKLFRALAPETTAVEVEGWQAVALTSTLPEMAETAAGPPIVRLLPAFDPFTIALYRQPGVLTDKATWPLVSRPQGWISPVVIVDGRIIGVWEHNKERGRLAVTVNLFEPAATPIWAAIEAEATRLGDFLGSPAELLKREP